MLGELKKDKNKFIWWETYAPFFDDLAKSEHIETYCKYITQIGNENSKKRLSENDAKITAFGDWLKGN